MEFTRQVSFYGQINSTFVKEHQVLMEYKIKLLNLFSRIENIGEPVRTRSTERMVNKTLTITKGIHLFL